MNANCAMADSQVQVSGQCENTQSSVEWNVHGIKVTFGFVVVGGRLRGITSESLSVHRWYFPGIARVCPNGMCSQRCEQRMSDR